MLKFLKPDLSKLIFFVALIVIVILTSKFYETWLTAALPLYIISCGLVWRFRRDRKLFNKDA